MDQIHRRFTAEQVQVLLKGYCQGMLDRPSIEDILVISKTRFFALLTQLPQLHVWKRVLPNVILALHFVNLHALGQV